MSGAFALSVLIIQATSSHFLSICKPVGWSGGGGTGTADSEQLRDEALKKVKKEKEEAEVKFRTIRHTHKQDGPLALCHILYVFSQPIGEGC